MSLRWPIALWNGLFTDPSGPDNLRLQAEAQVTALDEARAELRLALPPSSLYERINEAMRQLVRSLVNERGVIALLVTHDAQDVDALADRVVAYEPGRTVAVTE